MGGQLAKEQEQLKNLNCTFINTLFIIHSQREGASKTLQKLQ
jgi:hypothetical protein